MDKLEDIDVYCINLKSCADRKKYIIDHFFKNNIQSFLFFDAFLPTEMNEEYLKNALQYNMEPEEAACGYSSLMAIKHFVDNSSKDYLLVCEDDIDLSNIQKIDFKIKQLFSLFHLKIECIQLATSTRLDINFNPNIRLRSPWDFNTTCYLITKKYAKKVVEKYFDDDITLKNFKSTNIFDYRNKSIIKSSPVAEYVVYNTTNAITIPIFTYEIFQSSVNGSNERLEQTIKSRKDFLEYWNNFNNISLEDLVGL